MSESLEPFARAVRAALAAPAEEPLGVRFCAPLVTAIVADGTEGPRLEPALREVAAALERVGVPRGRHFVLLGCARPAGVSGLRDRARALQLALSLPVVAHDPDGPAWAAGRSTDGVAIALDDELREAEAVICVGRGDAAPARVCGGPYLLAPGVAGAALRAAFADAAKRGGERAAFALALAAEAAVPVDLALCWDDRGNVVAGRGRERFAAFAHAAGFE